MHLSLDGEYASVAAEVDAVRKTLRTSYRLLFEYIYVLYSYIYTTIKMSLYNVNQTIDI